MHQRRRGGFWKTIDEWLSGHLRYYKAFKAFFIAVNKLAPFGQLVVAAIALVVFLYAGNEWRQVENSAQELMTGTLNARLGPSDLPPVIGPVIM